MNPDPGRFIEVNGVSLYVEEHGAGVPVLLMHGWPDSARLWRNQVPFLVSNGFRVITPDMRGFGRSGRPQEVAAYRLAERGGGRDRAAGRLRHRGGPRRRP